MKIWYNSIIDTDRHVVEVRGDRVTIGRGTKNDIVLDSPYVAEEAAVLNRTNGSWELTALGINGLVVKQPGDDEVDNERRVAGGDRYTVVASLAIHLYPYTLTIDLPENLTRNRAAQRSMLDERMSQVIRDVHVELLRRIDLSGDAPTARCDDEYLLRLERTIDEIVRGHSEFAAGSPMIAHLAGHGLRDAVIALIAGGSQPTSDTGLYTDRHWSRLVSSVPDREAEIEATAKYLEAELIDEPSLNVLRTDGRVLEIGTRVTFETERFVDIERNDTIGCRLDHEKTNRGVCNLLRQIVELGLGQLSTPRRNLLPTLGFELI